MAGLTRRAALALGAAAAAVTALPDIPFAEATQPKPPLPAWVVGSPGEYNWQFVRGATEAEAKLEWVQLHCGFDKCEEGNADADCDCEFCFNYRDLDTERLKAWDNRPGEPSSGDWIRAGLGSFCSRCGEECHPDDGSKGVNDEAVCSECMTLADWDIVDPERAAELRAESADDDDPDSNASTNI